MSIWFRDKDGEDLIPLQQAAMVLNVKLQAVVKLDLPRYMVPNAAYKKKDIEALLMADITTPNALLRQLQEEHRQVQMKQKAHPSTRYRSSTGMLSPEEAKAAKQASKTNRKKPVSQDEVFRGWGTDLTRNKPLQPAVRMTEEEARWMESSRAHLKRQMAENEAFALEVKRAQLKEK